MNQNIFGKRLFIFAIAFFSALVNLAQSGINWTADGSSYTRVENGEVVQYLLPSNTKKVLISRERLIPTGQSNSLYIRDFSYSDDKSKVLIYTNTRKVWRADTRGDYWVLDTKSNQLTQLGKTRPGSSLMFAKISPDGTMAAYVSEHNIYLEDLGSHTIKLLTTTMEKCRG